MIITVSASQTKTSLVPLICCPVPGSERTTLQDILAQFFCAMLTLFLMNHLYTCIFWEWKYLQWNNCSFYPLCSFPSLWGTAMKLVVYKMANISDKDKTVVLHKCMHFQINRRYWKCWILQCQPMQTGMGKDKIRLWVFDDKTSFPYLYSYFLKYSACRSCQLVTTQDFLFCSLFYM